MSKLGSFVLPTVLVALMISASSSGVFAATELAYDDGWSDDVQTCVVGAYLAVRFSLPPGWSEAKLMTARFYRVVPGTNVNVHIFGSDGSTELTTPFTFDMAANGWNDADLSAKNIVVTGDFYVAIEWLVYAEPDIGYDKTSPDGRSYGGFGPPNPWFPFVDGDHMIRAVVEQVLAPTPVGGIAVPANKLAILAPYLALVGLVGAVTAAVAIQRKRKTQTILH